MTFASIGDRRDGLEQVSRTCSLQLHRLRQFSSQLIGMRQSNFCREGRHGIGTKVFLA